MFMVLMYLLPIFRFTSRMVSEKQSKIKDLTKLQGVNESPYWLSFMVFYFIGVTIVSVCCSLILVFGVFKYSSLVPIFLFFWLYGMSLFGYILLIQSFFKESVTLASVTSTLFFFITSFLDLLVENKYMAEHFTMLASILPTVAIRRAVATITKLENQKRGLNFDTINELIYNFRITTCYIMFTFAFVLLSALGIYFSQVLPSAGGFRKHPCFCFGKQHRTKFFDNDESERV